jgi:hypothetical protein
MSVIAFELLEEPRVDLAGLVDFAFGEAKAQRLGDHAQPVRGRRADRGADGVLGILAFLEAGDFDLVEAGQAGFEAAQRLLQRFRECAADRHDFADRLHRSGQDRLEAPGNFSKAKRGILVTT